jgi:hypothetical protein
VRIFLVLPERFSTLQIVDIVLDNFNVIFLVLVAQVKPSPPLVANTSQPRHNLYMGRHIVFAGIYWRVAGAGESIAHPNSDTLFALRIVELDPDTDTSMIRCPPVGDVVQRRDANIFGSQGSGMRTKPNIVRTFIES